MPRKTIKKATVPLVQDNTFRFINTLKFLSEQQIENIIDSARNGMISQINLLYEYVERNCLTLNLCQERRLSLPDWIIRYREQSKFTKYDQTLADEQYAFMVDLFSRLEDKGNLGKALTHLQSSVFRGLGVIQPVYNDLGSITSFNLLDNWNFSINPQIKNGEPELYWNPRGVNTHYLNLERIPEYEVIYQYNNSPINNYALRLYVAEQMGMESYASLIARKGLPATQIIMPEIAEEEARLWAEKAKQISQGGNGAFPSGTQIQQLNLDPSNGQAIQDFLNYLQKQLVLASTGGSLGSLTEATGMNSNVAEYQDKVFKQIIRQDASKIGDLINRRVAKYMLDLYFHNKPHYVYFDLDSEQRKSVTDVLQEAVMAKQAGLKIDLGQIEESTGYHFTEDVQTPSLFSEVKEEPKILNAEVEQEDIEPKEDEKAEEKKKALSLVSSFDTILSPIKILLKKLSQAKNKEEVNDDIDNIMKHIDSIENQEENEYISAVNKLYADEFAKEALKQQEEENK